jgi:L-amino acid N-acyltransferase YncA
VPEAYLDALDEREFAARWAERIAGDGSMWICVAEVDEMVCGFAAGGRLRELVDAYDGEVYALYLLAGMQGQGIGRGMFAWVARELAQQGMWDFVVWTLRENPSVGFYARLGGVVVAEAEIEIGGKRLEPVAYGWREFAGESQLSSYPQV